LRLSWTKTRRKKIAPGGTMRTGRAEGKRNQGARVKRSLLYDVGIYCLRRGQYREAKQPFELALAIRERVGPREVIVLSDTDIE
jgi:hypothetical protein